MFGLVCQFCKPLPFYPKIAVNTLTLHCLVKLACQYYLLPMSLKGSILAKNPVLLVSESNLTVPLSKPRPNAEVGPSHFRNSSLTSRLDKRLTARQRGPLSWKHPCGTDQILKVILYLIFNMRVLVRDIKVIILPQFPIIPSLTCRV